MSIKVGIMGMNNPVKISSDSPNEHIAIWGISGSGKSVRIREIVQDIQQEGRTVIAFDLAGQDFQNLEPVNRIYANKDGIALKIFDTGMVDRGKESYVNFLSFLVDSFTNVYKLGVRQQGALRTAIEYGLQNCSRYETEMDAIAAGLEEQESDVAKGVHNKLWQILHGGILRKSDKRFHSGEINILDFSGINPSSQKEIAELIMAFIWKKLRMEERTGERICLVIDECQHLLAKSNSVLLEMLRESRKYGVNIILSTQSSLSFTNAVMSAVNQAAVQLYFRPSVSDMKRIAEIIAPHDAGQWLLKLKKLNVGESVATGNLSVKGKEISYPLILRSAYEDQVNPENRHKWLGDCGGEKQ